MKRLLDYVRPLFPRVFQGLAVKGAGTVMELLLPLILSHVLKNVVVGGQLAPIVCWGAVMCACAAAAFLLNMTANRMASKVARDATEQIRSDLFNKTLRLSAAQTDRFTIPSLEARITTDTYHVQGFISAAQRIGVRAPILLVGGIGITLFLDRWLSLVMIVVLPLIGLTGFLISRRGVQLFSRTQRSVDAMVGVVREDVQGIRVIKALSTADYENRRYDAVNRALSANEEHAGRIMGLSSPAMTALLNTGIVAVIALSALRVSRGLSSPEIVIAFMQYFSLISGAMMAVTRIFVMFTKCTASARRIAEVLDTREDLTVLPAQAGPVPAGAPEIEFDDVCFRYPGSANGVEHISFSLPRGGTLGVIGATGSGKSTLAMLLTRLYDADSGTVRLAGRDVRTIPHEERCALFGCAMQQDFLYADTIEENIRFGRALTHEQIVRAAVIAQADEFISAFEDGYAHALAQKGSNLSGGQKQRLFIARALAARPEILVLDDSSSALDYRTDAALRAALAEQYGDATVVTVAQRVSSIKHCDLILVLDAGRVIGSGTHEELLASCPQYAEISRSQMGGAIID